MRRQPLAHAPTSVPSRPLNIAADHVAARALRRSGLTRAAMRGAQYWPAPTAWVRWRARPGSRCVRRTKVLVAAYHADLDGTGHGHGVGSDAWYYQLAHVDKLAEQLAGALPSDTTLYITADHGMVDVSAEDRIDVDNLPDLRAGVSLLGGEPRARHVYTRPRGRRRRARGLAGSPG